MKYTILITALLLLVVGVVSAESYTFKQNEDVNYRFRCLDENGSYCSAGTQLLISIEYPDGSNALDNISMTYNPTYFNISLPTDKPGVGYSALITSPTSVNTTTEFKYGITQTGKQATWYSLFPLLLIYVFAIVFLIATFIVDEELFVYLCGICFLIAGVYVMINGIAIYDISDLTIKTISYLSIGLGLLFIIGAYIFNHYESSSKEESD